MSAQLEQVMQVHSAEAERAVLGAVLLRPDAFYQVDLEPGDFYDAKNRAVWAACQALAKAGQTLDPIAIEGELVRAGRVDAVGGLPYLASLVSAVPTADNVGVYAGRVRAASLKRTVARRTLDALLSQAEGEEYQTGVITAASSVSAGVDDGASFSVAVDEAFRQVSDLMDARSRGEQVSWGIPTGFDALDFQIGGVEPETVTIIGGRTSQGKSVLTRQIALNLARAGHGVHYFSPEDRRRTVALRALVDEGRVDMRRVRAGEMTREECGAIIEARAQILEFSERVYIDDHRGLTIEQIAHRVRRHKQRLNTKVVVLDYVQLVRAPKSRDRKGEVDAAVYGFTEICEREHVAGILVSQLNREVTKRQSAEPTLADLKESGDLESAATNVLLLWRDAAFDAAGQGEVIVAKAKNDRCGFVPLLWDGAHSAFRDLPASVTSVRSTRRQARGRAA